MINIFCSLRFFRSKNRVLVIYNWEGQFVTKYYVGMHGGENIHVEYEDGKRYLYAKKMFIH